MPDVENSRKTAEKGAEWVTVKQPKNSRKNSRNARKTAEKQSKQLFCGCFGCFSGFFFGCFTVTFRLFFGCFQRRAFGNSVGGRGDCNTNSFFSNFSGAPGDILAIFLGRPGDIPPKKFGFPGFRRIYRNFSAPTPSRGRPPPHRSISRPKSLGLGSFFLPEILRARRSSDEAAKSLRTSDQDQRRLCCDRIPTYQKHPPVLNALQRANSVPRLTSLRREQNATERFQKCLFFFSKENYGGSSLVAHDCGYPLSRCTCRATHVAADFLDFITFCRCSTGVALRPLKILVSHLLPTLCREVSHRNLGLKRCRATRGCRSYSCGCRATLCN